MLKKREQGVTLLEVLLVVVLMSVAASVAVPTFRALDDLQLELVGREVQRMIRFARSEAVRTGLAYGIEFSENDTRLRLYKHDSPKNYSVYHPVDRQIVNMIFAGSEQPVSISSKSIKFESLIINSQDDIVFTAGTGVPVSDSIGSTHLLEQASIELSHNANVLLIEIAPLSGRVTLQ